ncbi:MAG: hypothetical protein H6705_04905 [Myxococcales bacterium]|nr:hypothetical protein [Myxococcales bacterium]
MSVGRSRGTASGVQRRGWRRGRASVVMRRRVAAGPGGRDGDAAAGWAAGPGGRGGDAAAGGRRAGRAWW